MSETDLQTGNYVSESDFLQRIAQILRSGYFRLVSCAGSDILRCEGPSTVRRNRTTKLVGLTVEGWHRLLPDYFHQDSLGSATVELAVEDLLPRAEIEFSLRDGDHHFPAHDLSLHVTVGVVFAGSVVGVSLGRGIEGGETFQPLLVILVETRLVIVDEDRGCDVHRVAYPRLGYS